MVKVRKARKKDIKQMLGIIKMNSPKFPTLLAKKEIEEMFSKSLTKPTYLVVEINKKIVGFGGFTSSWVDGMIYEMFWVSVHSDNKNQGIGRKIVNEIVNEIKKIKKPKPKKILISTEIPKYYKKYGFEVMGKKYDKKYVIMGLEL